MTLIYCKQSETRTVDITILDADDVAITPDSGDVIRARVIRTGTTLLTVASNAATAAGSTFTKNSPSSGLNRLRLDATDLAALEPGEYTLTVDMQDAEDSDTWKLIEDQVICVVP